MLTFLPIIHVSIDIFPSDVALGKNINITKAKAVYFQVVTPNDAFSLLYVHDYELGGDYDARVLA